MGRPRRRAYAACRAAPRCRGGSATTHSRASAATEFVVLIPAGAAAEVETVAAALIEVIREHDALHDPPVTASIGLALVDDAALDAKHLLATADRAMYDAKAAGPGPYSVRTPPIDETATT